VNFAFENGYIYLFLERFSEIIKNITDVMYIKEDENLFEVGNLNESLINKKLFYETYKELDGIFSFIDCLNESEKKEEI